MRLPFRARLLLAFAPVVLVMGAVSTLAGLSFINHTVMKEAMLRVEMDLNSAWSAFEEEKTRLLIVVGGAAQQEALQEFARSRLGFDELAHELDALRRLHGIDYLAVADSSATVLVRSRYPHAGGWAVSDDPVVQGALRGEASSGTILLERETLLREGEEFAERAYIPLIYTEKAEPTERAVEERGMAIEAAVPLRGSRGEIVAVVYGGTLLNRKFGFVDRVRDTVFGDKKHLNRPVGTVTLFLGDVRIATNVTLDTGARAVGTRVSAVVSERVLEGGARFADRAYVVNDWYLSAYDPIRDPTGRIIGIIYVGMLEKIYSGYRATLVRQYLGIGMAAFLVCVAVSLTLAGDFRRPIQRLVAKTRALAAGDLAARVAPTRSSREMHELGLAFNQLAETLERDRAEIAEASAALRKAYAAAEERNRAYRETLGFVTHELKSPLASIVFAIHALRDQMLGPLQPEQEQILKSASMSADHLHDTIVNYLNLSRIEEGELRLRLGPVRFRDDIVLPVIGRVAELAGDRKMRIDSEVPETLEGTGDPDLLSSVFQNLLSNAIKYGREGSRIRLTGEVDPESGSIRFKVFNEGPGFDPEDAALLFRKFSRLPAHGEDTRSGTGLGLFVSARIIEKHGGSIRADSHPGRWAEFSFEIPAAGPGIS